jgi:hypothetical protein
MCRAYGCRQLYARHGVRHYWILDPASRTLAELVLADGEYALRGTTSAPSRLKTVLFPELPIELSAVFAESAPQRTHGDCSYLGEGLTSGTVKVPAVPSSLALPAASNSWPMHLCRLSSLKGLARNAREGWEKNSGSMVWAA